MARVGVKPVRHSGISWRSTRSAFRQLAFLAVPETWAWLTLKAWHVNMERSCVFVCLKCFVLLQLTTNVVGWNSEDLELFDLVEEVNQNFYDVLGVDQVSCGR